MRTSTTQFPGSYPPQQTTFPKTYLKIQSMVVLLFGLFIPSCNIDHRIELTDDAAPIGRYAQADDNLQSLCSHAGGLSCPSGTRGIYKTCSVFYNTQLFDDTELCDRNYCLTAKQARKK